MELGADFRVGGHFRNDDAQSVESVLARLLLGANSTQNNDKLLQTLMVLAKYYLWSFDKHLREKLVLDLGLLEVVVQRQQRQPSWDDLCCINVRFLVLYDAAQGCNGVVASVVELRLLALLFFCGVVHLEADRILERLEAQHALRLECCPTMLGNHSHAVDRSLSNGTVLRIRVGTDLVHDVWVNGPQEIRAKELHHVVKNKKNKLHIVLRVLLRDLRENSSQ